MDMKTMKQLTYHIGLCVRAFPSDRQKQIIRKNAGVNRFVYNRLVGVNQEMYELSKTAQYSPTDRDRLLYLKSAYGTTSQMRIAIPFLNDPDIDCFSIANAKRITRKHGISSEKYLLQAFLLLKEGVTASPMAQTAIIRLMF